MAVAECGLALGADSVSAAAIDQAVTDVLEAKRQYDLPADPYFNSTKVASLPPKTGQ
jgi:hypothetical protein